MPKLKLPTKSPRIDMTPMVDLFSLLLTFFMLTATFRPNEVQVETPSSVSDKKAPEKNVITITVSKNNKVYFFVDNGTDTINKLRKSLLERIAIKYKLDFSQQEKAIFSSITTPFGLPVSHLKEWLNAKDENVRAAIQTRYETEGTDGIPLDSLNNQLSDWVLLSRRENQNLKVSVKGDSDADYDVVKKVLNTLQEINATTIDLTTNLKKVD